MSSPVCLDLGAGPGHGLSIARRFTQDGHLAVLTRLESEAAPPAQALVEEEYAAEGLAVDLTRSRRRRAGGRGREARPARDPARQPERLAAEGPAAPDRAGAARGRHPRRRRVAARRPGCASPPLTGLAGADHRQRGGRHPGRAQRVTLDRRPTAFTLTSETATERRRVWKHGVAEETAAAAGMAAEETGAAAGTGQQSEAGR